MAKIIIDIDDNLYTRLFDNGVDNYDDAIDMAKAIRKGIPLPKGHGRLCDMDEALKCIEETADCKIKQYAIGMLDWAMSKRTIIKADKESGDKE